MIDTLMILTAAAVGVYLVIGLIHAGLVQSDNLVRPGQFWTLVFRWPWKGRSWL